MAQRVLKQAPKSTRNNQKNSTAEIASPESTSQTFRCQMVLRRDPSATKFGKGTIRLRRWHGWQASRTAALRTFVTRAANRIKYGPSLWEIGICFWQNADIIAYVHLLSKLYPFFVPTLSIKSDSIQNISILYQLSCPNGVHYVRTVSISYLNFIHFFYITSNLYPNNTPISHWVKQLTGSLLLHRW